MTSDVAVIVRCGSLGQAILPTALSVARQEPCPHEIVLLSDPSTPEPLRPWIEALASSRHWRYIHSRHEMPGAQRNEAVGYTKGSICQFVDAGDLLDARLHAACLELFDSDPAIAWVTTGVVRHGPGGYTSRVVPPTPDLAALIDNPEFAHSATMFRRDAWTAGGGFDESLPTLDDYEFWLRLHVAGRRGAAVPEALLVRSLRADGIYRLPWDRDRRGEATTAIVGKHAAVFSEDPAAAVLSRIRRLRNLDREHAALLDEHHHVQASLLALAAAKQVPAPCEADDVWRLSPVSRQWGYERGLPVDRRYIERFLADYRDDIRGAVLEVQEDDYTRRFGGNRVVHHDVIDINHLNTRATIISDLRNAANVPPNSYDCILLTQTLHVIDDVRAVVRECWRILRPGGVLLATLPSVSRVCVEYGPAGDCWRMTEHGARSLITEVFPHAQVSVRAYGNILAASAFLYGLSADELDASHYEIDDPYFPVLVGVRAVKPRPRHRLTSSRRAFEPASRSDRDDAGVGILLYHRVADLAQDPYRLAVAPQDFREQLAYLREHYRVVPLADLVAELQAQATRLGTLALTFDDGYADNYTTASPLLSSAGIPATFFLTTADLDGQDRYWWDTLENLFLTPSPVPPWLILETAEDTLRLPTATAVDRQHAWNRIYDCLLKADLHERTHLMTQLQRWSSGPPRPPGTRRLNADEIRSLCRRAGHDIGAHSVNHVWLPAQAPEVTERELRDARQQLEQVTDRAVDLFAYPYGAWDAHTRRAVATAGFAAGVVCGDCAVERHPDPLTLPRLDVVAHRQEAFAEWLRRTIGPPAGTH